MIYLDYAATSPMLPEAIAAYAQAAETVYGNSASLHDAGGVSSAYVEAVRAQLAEALNVSKDGIYFTGSGTESNVLAICSYALAQKKRHIITSQAEHTSVHAAMNYLQQHGFTIERLPLQANGVVAIADVEAAITDDTALISLQYVNSEIGTIQPVEDVLALARAHNIFMHVDCVQSFQKLPPIQADAVTVSAHKIGGPKGVGACYINPRKRIVPLFPGMTHERGIRGGTLDVPGIVAFGAALTHFRYDIERQTTLRAQFIAALQSSHTTIIGAQANEQLPSIIGLCIQGVEGQMAMLHCNSAQIAISTGSACDINSASGTKAILALGKSFHEARQFCRLSTGMHSTVEDMLAAAHTLNSLIHTRYTVQ